MFSIQLYEYNWLQLHVHILLGQYIVLIIRSDYSNESFLNHFLKGLRTSLKLLQINETTKVDLKPKLHQIFIIKMLNNDLNFQKLQF